MGDDITIGVTEIVNNIEVTAQPNDQVIDIEVIDNSDDVTLNVTPNVIEVNINKGSSYARWGSIFGNLTDQADLTNALFNKADLVDGKVPSYQLPSFVDDVIEVANYAALPTVGEIGKIYITLDTNKIYRWSGSIYIEIASNQAIWGAITGSLTNQTDLVNALNLKADKSTTLTINGTTFDLSANRTYTIPTHDAVTLGTANGLSLSGQVLSLGLSGASSTGALSSTDWNTFNNKLSSLSGAVLTTTDQSVAGVKTFTNLAKFTNNTGSFAVEIDTTSSDALVVKNNGTTTLQISRSGEILGTKYRVSGGFASQFLKANGDLDSTAYTPESRTITINGVTQNLTANRSFTVATHDAVTIGTANGLSLSGQALSLALASGSTTGALSAADWTTFNNKQNTITNPITGSGTINFLPKFTQSGSIGNSQIFDNGTFIGIGISTGLNRILQVVGSTPISHKQTNSPLEMIIGQFDDSGNAIINNTANAILGFSTNNQRAMTILPNLNVGIGKTTTSSLLDVNGQIRSEYTNAAGNASVIVRNLSSASGGTSQFISINDAGRALRIQYAASGGFGSSALSGGITGEGAQIFTDGNYPLLLGTNVTANMYLGTNGNVGIGTTSPSVKLEITGAVKANTNAFGAEGGFIINYSSSTSSRSWRLGSDLNAFGDFSIGQSTTQTGSTYTERLYINASGNVGIGTTSPSTICHLYKASFPILTIQSSSYQSSLGIDTSSGTLVLNNESNGALAFNTNAIERMRITSGGRVGVGFTSPIAKLSVRGEDNTSSNFSLEAANSSGSSLFYVRNDGATFVANLGTGLVYSSGGALTSTNPSDKRLKDDITDLQYGLNEILQLRPVSYNWKNDTINQGKQFGFIAQEVQEVMPELISEFTTTEDEEEVVRLGLDKEGIYATLVNAIKELKAEIELLKQK